MRFHRKLIAIGTAVGASLCVAATPPGVVAADDSTENDPCSFTTGGAVEVCFSEPAGDGDEIFRSLGALVDEVSSGDTLRIMMYKWGDQNGDDDQGANGEDVDTPPEQLAKKVVDAKARGADVQVILDEKAAGKTAGKQPAEILDGKVPVEVCTDKDTSDDDVERPDNGNGTKEADCLMWDYDGYYGDASPLPMNHTKLFLATIDGVKYVAAGSSNLTTYDHTSAFNDFVRIRGDADLHRFLKDWFEKVQKDNWGYWDTNENRDSSGDPDGDDMPARAWVYPRQGEGDPLVGQLANVTACSSDGDGDGDWDKRVWMAMSGWNKDQREKILGQFARLHDAGCDVQVLLHGGEEPTQDEIVWKREIRNRISGDPYDSDEVRVKCNMHHKFFVFDAKYQGDWHEVAITGSEVLAEGSRVYSSELNVRVGGDHEEKEVNEYIDRMQKLWKEAPLDACG